MTQNHTCRRVEYGFVTNTRTPHCLSRPRTVIRFRNGTAYCYSRFTCSSTAADSSAIPMCNMPWRGRVSHASGKTFAAGHRSPWTDQKLTGPTCVVNAFRVLDVSSTLPDAFFMTAPDNSRRCYALLSYALDSLADTCHITYKTFDSYWLKCSFFGISSLLPMIATREHATCCNCE